MKVLAVDTSTRMSSVSIIEDDIVLGDISLGIEESHSEKLIPTVQMLLDQVKLSLDDIDLFAIAKGPGSFTGLRIGMTSLKAICQALDKPIVGISTLKALSHKIISNGYIVAVLDARGTRYFAGIYRWQEEELVKEFEGLVEDKALYEKLKDLDEVTIVGDGVVKLSQEIKDLAGVKLGHAGLNSRIGVDIALLAKKEYEEGRLDDYNTIEPSYLRKSQAEINFENKDI